MASDVVLLTAAFGTAYVLRLLHLLIYERSGMSDHSSYIHDFVLKGTLIAIVFIPLAIVGFYFSGFYTYGRSYSSKYKLLVIFRSVTLVFLAFGSFVYMFQWETLIPRAILPMSWAFSLGLLSSARVYSTVFKRAVRSEQAPEPRISTDSKFVLVIGGAGYIGSALIPRLLQEGLRVRCFDICLFGEDTVDGFSDDPNFELIKGDYRQIEHLVGAFSGVETVIHLGGIVGDPACAVDERLTVEVNLTSTKVIAQIAKAHGIRRFLFASSCSVYGQSDEVLDENSRKNPVSLYAKSKIASEKVLREMSDENFAPVLMRFGTIYGISKRTRFDLVVNLLSAKALQEKRITVFGGDQWRPFVHVEDVSRAILKMVVAPVQVVRGEVFNVGSDAQNYTLRQVGEAIRNLVPDAEIIEQEFDGDKRNYRVSFKKIRQILDFTPEWTLEEGIEQVIEKFRSGEIDSYQDSKYSNLKTLQALTPESLRNSDENWELNMLDQLDAQCYGPRQSIVKLATDDNHSRESAQVG